MRGFVAVTDGEWFRYLRSLGTLEEVNFWRPGGQTGFAALSPGEPVIFKLHHPDNAVVGGGFFSHFSRLPSQLAWDAFGAKNGAPTYEEMRRRIQRYRRAPADPHAEYVIGCVMLADPFYFDEPEWLPAPPDFAREIVQGKTYDLSAGAGRELWEQIETRLGAGQAAARAPVAVAEAAAMYGEPVLTRHRLGQGTFRVLVTDVYGRRCAVTGERTLPVLEAAHIRPVSAGGTHQIVNGLLLRSDLHTLFDRGYVTVTPTHELRVSGRLKLDFDNGEHYRRYEGTALVLPQRRDQHPDQFLLEWHGDSVFLG